MGLHLSRAARQELGAAFERGLERLGAFEARSLADAVRAVAERRPELELEVAAGRLRLWGLLVDLLRETLVEHPELLDRLRGALVRQLGGAAVERLTAEFVAEYVTPLAGSPPAAKRETGDEAPPTADPDLGLIEVIVFAASSAYRELAPPVEWLAAGDWQEKNGPALELIALELDRLAESGGGRALFDDTTAPVRASLAEPWGPESTATDPPGLDRPETPAVAVAPAPPSRLTESRARELEAALDQLREETRPRFPPGPGPPPEVPAFSGLAEEPANYTPDHSWMPRVAMVAKNVYIWLRQLSERYGEPIECLDQVPEAAIDELVADGFSALWLIGLWQRSPASERIKRLRGQSEAAASAYAIVDYVVAEELGGDAALHELSVRARRKGLRLAADMVPNHMAIDARWVVEHPDRFLSVRRPPFPSYTFEGEDLAPELGIELQIEDHYFDHSDAAVVFRWRHRKSGEERYVYHGNDGTSVPWNDTAQLDFLRSETREAVIRTIVRLAREFQILRFDAAMTLASRHVQRLWHPQPGHGGAIPSRSEHALADDEFARRLPREFWREAIERVRAEAPGTLLLAEAFWLMETYFVRDLGFHRVYNSAFMHLLRERENRKFRELLKEVLAFDPRLLGRYVNYMSNPDEETAVGQFGRGDRYFGVAALMATLPGLPLFGHGQVEGLAERYGMEYRRPRTEEQPDLEMIERHRRLIAPLLCRRSLFADGRSFELFDLVRGDGSVDEDVLAWLNHAHGRTVLLVFLNADRHTRGAVRESALRATPDGEGSPGRQRLVDLIGAAASEALVGWREVVGGHEHLTRTEELAMRGLPIELGPYELKIFEDWRAIADDDGIGLELARRLGTRGVRSLERERLRVRLTDKAAKVRAEVARRLVGGEGQEAGRVPLDDGELAGLGRALAAVLEDELREQRGDLPWPSGTDQQSPAYESADAEAANSTAVESERWLLYRFAVVAGRWLESALTAAPRAADALEASGLGAALVEALARRGREREAAERTGRLAELTLELDWDTQSKDPSAESLLGDLAETRAAQELLGLHWSGRVRWFNKEAWNDLLEAWVLAGETEAHDSEAAVSPVAGTSGRGEGDTLKTRAARLTDLAEEVGYRWDALRERVAAEVGTPGRDEVESGRL